MKRGCAEWDGEEKELTENKGLCSHVTQTKHKRTIFIVTILLTLRTAQSFREGWFFEHRDEFRMDRDSSLVSNQNTNITIEDQQKKIERQKRNRSHSFLGVVVEQFKSIRRMARQNVPMKDVVACDKLRGGGKQPLIRRSPNRETCCDSNRIILN